MISKVLKQVYHYFLISKSGLFDPSYYLETYSDILKADINPLWHYVNIGWKEGRNPSKFFNTNYYLDRNSDVRNKKNNPLVHYLQFGGYEGRNPSNEFDSNWYLSNYSDVKKSRMNPLVHYVKFGRFEMRLKKKPLITVVIPIFDRTKLLIESIESILTQTYVNFELILVCDGSPQDTINIVKQYEKKKLNIRAFFFDTNSGNAVRGRNVGIREAIGNYIAFQDSDDIADPDRLMNSIKILIQYNVDIVYGSYRIIDDGSRDIGLHDGQEILSQEFDFEVLKKENFLCLSTVMVDVKALEEAGGFNSELKYREDHELWLRLAFNGYKFKAIDKVLTNLRIHSGNLEIKYKEDDEYWYKKMLDIHKEKSKFKKIAFITQPEYFRFIYEKDLNAFVEVREFRLNFNRNSQYYSDLLDYDADFNIFFRGEHLPNGVLEKLNGITINLSSEPFPRRINNRFKYSRDSLERYRSFRTIRNKPFDYVFHYDESSLNILRNDGLKLSGEFVFPVATNVYKPQQIAKKWDIFFIGRSTSHREQLFSSLKHDFNFLHIAHGVWGRDLANYINSSKICLNVHAENEISWEPRVQLMLACGAFVISEPLTPNRYLRPNLDYIEISDKEELYNLTSYYLNHEDERKLISESGLMRTQEYFSSEKIFKTFIKEIEENYYPKFEVESGSFFWETYNLLSKIWHFKSEFPDIFTKGRS